jgi:hypothetical protein
MKWVFLLDVEICPDCGGKRSVIAQVTKPEAIVAILEGRNRKGDSPSRRGRRR